VSAGFSVSIAVGLAFLMGSLACHRSHPHRDASDSGGSATGGASPSIERARATQAASMPDRAQRLTRLEGSLRVIEDGLHESPRDRWDPEYVVAQVGREPRVLFEWVRDNTSWIPYRGVLRGPVGVLMDRQGNSLDRALLLASLLDKAGDTVRLAHGELTREQAVALLPGLVSRDAASVAPAFPVKANGDLFRIAAENRLDSASLDRTLKAEQDAVAGTYTELNSRVADQVERLLRVVQRPSAATEWTERFEKAVEALRDHWWVQRQDGESWTDLDLLAREAGSATRKVSPTETMAVAELASELHHQLAIRVITEQWHNGALTENRVLEQVLRPADLTGETLILQIWPGELPKEVHPDPDSRFGLRGVMLEQHRWGVALLVGSKVLTQGVFNDRGEVLAPPPNAFVGLGTGIAATAHPSATDSSGARNREFTAMWIEYQMSAPGESPRTFRRAVFDLLGPAHRAAGAPRVLALNETQRLTRGLALMLRAEILPITCRVAPEFLERLNAQSILANKEVLRMILRSGVGEGLPSGDTLRAASAPAVSPLLSLALARLKWSTFAERTYVDRLGLITQHRHPGIGGNGFGLRGAFDILAGELGVTLAQPDGFVVRLAQGVLDANVEALWWMGDVPINTGEAWKSSRDWETIGPAEKNRVAGLRLPQDARFRIAQDLEAGQVVVAPKDSVRLGSEYFAGWWSIDPATGATTGVSGTTRGQCGAEYGVTVEAVVAEAANSFAYEYVLCQGIAQAFNAFRGTMAEVQRRGYWAWWVPQIEGAADPRDVYKESAGGCLIGAIMGGMLSTTALLPFVIRGAEGADLAIAASSRQTLSSLDNFAPRVSSPKPKGYPKPRTSTGPVAVQGPGGTLAEGVTPKTLVDEPVPPTAPGPRVPKAPPTPAEIARAREAVRETYQQSEQAFKDLIAYRDRYPPEGWRGMKYQHPNYEDLVDDALGNDMMQKHFAHQKAMQDLEELLQAANAAKPVLGPNLYQIAAGSAGVASSFYPFRWPD
jgi:hypothetical protein